MKWQISLLLFTLLIGLFLVDNPLVSRSQGQTSVIVNNAETTSTFGLTTSPEISSKLAEVPSLVIHAFAEATFKPHLQAVPPSLASLLDQLSPNVIFAFGEANFSRRLTAVPAELQLQLGAIKPLVLFAFADASYTEELHYPTALLNDTSAPQITAIEQVMINNIAYLRWNTNEFTTYTLNYGATSGTYSEQMSEDLFAKVHLFNIMTLTPGQTYYAKLSVTDRSGNVNSSAEFTIKRDTTQYLYLPLITR